MGRIVQYLSGLPFQCCIVYTGQMFLYKGHVICSKVLSSNVDSCNVDSSNVDSCNVDSCNVNSYNVTISISCTSFNSIQFVIL